MKKLLIFLTLMGAQYSAYGDARLDFIVYSKEGKQASLSYIVKAPLLRLDDANSRRFNLFNSKQQAFISMNLRNGNIARMDKNILAQRARQLNRKRLQRVDKILQELDKKRPSMSDTELEVTEEVKNQMKYPRQFGAYTLNRLIDMHNEKNIAGIDCRLYQLRRQDKQLKTLCIASRKQLGLSSEDFETLLAYEEFNYQVQTDIMLAMGESNFALVSLKNNHIQGIVIEETDSRKGHGGLQRILTHLSTAPIDKEQLKPPKIPKTQLK